jgi:hypothetical protein
MSLRLSKEGGKSSARSFGLIPNEGNIKERIEQKAYELWEGRGRAHGQDMDDWLEAERIVLGEFTVKRNTTHRRSKGQNE